MKKDIEIYTNSAFNFGSLVCFPSLHSSPYREEVDKMYNALQRLGKRELLWWECGAIREFWSGHRSHVAGQHSNKVRGRR